MGRFRRDRRKGEGSEMSRCFKINEKKKESDKAEQERGR
jgi:hypothetical protein